MTQHLISVALRHQETEQGITKGKPIDRLTIASDIKNGLIYIIIYSGKNSWKKGHQIHTFSIEGIPYLRIDRNKVKLDFLGDIQEFPILKSESTKKLESHPEPIIEQLSQLNDLHQQTNELENILSTQPNLSKDLPTHQTSKVNKSENPVDTEIEHKIINILQKQNQKLDEIEKKLHNLTTTKTIK